tara:strand:- start:66 stop:425 length:360 start_codon:yes stop_codon:yes gene_type:complete
MGHKVIIAGGRDFKATPHHVKTVNTLIKKLNTWDVEIVSGGARGADKFGEDFAKTFNLPLRVFPADWDRYGKSAGYRRNAEMAEYATHLIAFWDGSSRGTKHMIDLADQKELKVKVIKY